jgi:hypothetical protein
MERFAGTLLKASFAIVPSAIHRFALMKVEL